jgi:hypothetical protein
MRKITAKEFYAMILKNPSVFEHWDTPLEITEYVNCENLEITHLSKHLTFSGKNKEGIAADFAFCPLKIATGTFHGFINFNQAKIETIQNLNVTQSDKNGWSASFIDCKALTTATGNYHGYVMFSYSGIHSIKNLYIENKNEEGSFAEFYECPNLHSLEGWDLSKQIDIEPEKLEAETKRRKALKMFHKKTKVKELPFL